MEKIITAISTPLGSGAISIVRMSGNGCLNIAQKVFKAKGLDYQNITPRLLYLGNFKLEKNINEFCFMVFFKSPYSYTGEDMVEFQIHGGSILSQKVLSILIQNGATMAQPGEFTKRAFENGKVSLDEAESIIGEINAESESELKASLSLAEGRLKNKIKSLQSSLTESIAQIEATLDYPEEDFEKSAKDKIFADIQSISSSLDKFISDANLSRFVSKGINIAIVGSPNVGKSSLLNSLIGQDKAIVTDIAGTTRDVINETISFNGIKFNFIDTAGIRDAVDKVEQIGIEKSKQSIESADVVLFVLDASRDENQTDKEIKSLLSDKKNVLTIVNKVDMTRVLPTLKNEIQISALKEENIDFLKNKIYQMVINEEIDYSKTLVINERQIQILNECKNITNEILANQNESMDIIAMLIKSLWNTLGKITGESENEQIIDLIFSKFCLGK